MKLAKYLKKSTEDSMCLNNGNLLPRAIASFDTFERYHLDYLVAASNILCNVYGINESKHPDERARISNILENWPVPAEPSMEESENLESEQGSSPHDEFERLVGELDTVASDSNSKLCDWKIDIDVHNDFNYHTEFITATACLYASVYGFDMVSQFDCKMTTGRLEPKSIVTQAVTAGIIVTELIKSLQVGLPFKPSNVDNLTELPYRNSYVQLGLFMYFAHEPNLANRTESESYDVVRMETVVAKPAGFTAWNKTIIDGNQSLGEFLDKLSEQTEGLRCTYLGHSSAQVLGAKGFIYEREPWRRSDKVIYEQRLVQPLKDIIDDLYGTTVSIEGNSYHYLVLDCEVEDEQQTPYTIPQLYCQWVGQNQTKTI